jgi:myosin heavy subunit
VATALAKKRGEKVTRGGAGSLESSEEAKEDEAEFSASLTRWREMTSLRDARAAAFDRERLELTARLRDASAEADAARLALVERLEQTAKTAQYEKTGKALASSSARRRLAEERDAETSLSRARLVLIESTRARSALERRVKEKEHLAEGLKLIDFEQLKMETVALKEKFHERAGDYEKIKRKTSDVVQVLTHAKEKLRFTREENRELTEEMERVDRQSKVKGDVMQRLKDEIAAFKKENEAMQSEAATITDPTLLDDYADKKRDAREAKARLETIAAELELLALETTDLSGKNSTSRAARPKAAAPGKTSGKGASAAARRAAGAPTPLLEL